MGVLAIFIKGLRSNFEVVRLESASCYSNILFESYAVFWTF